MTGMVQIPRFDKGKSEFLVFNHVEKFAELANKLYSIRKSRFDRTIPPVTVLRELGQTTKLPVPEIQELLQAVVDAAFSYRKPEHKPAPREYEPIFSEQDTRNWTRHKRELKLAIEMHIPYISKIQKTQVNCWTSRDKVQQYATMMDTAQSAIQHYKNDAAEFKKRSIAIRGLKFNFLSKQKIHMQNVAEYEKLLAEEERIREKITEISAHLRSEISSRIRAKIEEGLADLVSASYPTEKAFHNGIYSTRKEFAPLVELTPNENGGKKERDEFLPLTVYPDNGGKRCTISYDTAGISERLYDVTCKLYKFGIPPIDTTYVTFNNIIDSPKMVRCGHSFKNLTQTYGRPDNIFISASSSVSQDSTNDNLNLKKGDKVKLLFLCNGGSRGFGWVKHSSLSFKQWGFFQISDLVPKHPHRYHRIGGAPDL